MANVWPPIHTHPSLTQRVCTPLVPVHVFNRLPPHPIPTQYPHPRTTNRTLKRARNGLANPYDASPLEHVSVSEYTALRFARNSVIELVFKDRRFLQLLLF
jgi:hypothetical protein